LLKELYYSFSLFLKFYFFISFLNSYRHISIMW